MRRLFLALLAAVLAGMLNACDFTPTLDVPLPNFEPALTISGALVADSTVEVRVTAAADPYAPGWERNEFQVPDGTAAELLRDGVPAGPLRLEPSSCLSYFGVTPGEEPEAYECGSFVSDVQLETGRTYTVRVSAPGYPDAEATVTVPRRVPATATSGPVTETDRANGEKTFETDLSLRFRDPAGPGQHYGLIVIGEAYTQRSGGIQCSGDDDCEFVPDSGEPTYVAKPAIGYTTTDPILLASARTLPSTGNTFVSFTDQAFDGEERTFSLRARETWYPWSGRAEEPGPPAAVWLVTADADTYEAYQIAWFGYPLGDEPNPFQEPIDLPSNVRGGYGLLGAVAITEVPVAE